jgi:cation diffusion facilitator family transporter
MDELALDRPHAHSEHAHSHGPRGSEKHAHLHGVADPAYASSARGLRALKWSVGVLGIAALIELAVVMLSGSVAVLADTIHNAADACTAIPLGIAFVLMRRAPTARFTYGYGRIEDLAGVVIVIIIFASALAAGYEAAQRLIEPQPVVALGAVAIAGVIGFVANETAAFIRIRAGREINSAALVADGYHARVDGLASLAVSAGALAVELGYPRADPMIGLAIAVAILGIVWQSGSTVFVRLIDGVEPELVATMRAAGEQVAGVRSILGLRARWLGHRLHGEADIAVDPALSVHDCVEIAERFRQEVMRHLPALDDLRVGIVEDRGEHR